MKIHSVCDKEFAQYGRVLTELDTKELISAMEKTPVPDDVIYVPSDKELESLNVYDVMSKVVYGDMPVEVYATTLHYAPCGVNNSGFRCTVVLPKGTNYDVKRQKNTGEDRLLAATNKWLIAHKEAHIDGAFEGLIGENPEV